MNKIFTFCSYHFFKISSLLLKVIKAETRIWNDTFDKRPSTLGVDFFLVNFFLDPRLPPLEPRPFLPAAASLSSPLPELRSGESASFSSEDARLRLPLLPLSMSSRLCPVRLELGYTFSKTILKYNDREKKGILIWLYSWAGQVLHLEETLCFSV